MHISFLHILWKWQTGHQVKLRDRTSSKVWMFVIATPSERLPWNFQRLIEVAVCFKCIPHNFDIGHLRSSQFCGLYILNCALRGSFLPPPVFFLIAARLKEPSTGNLHYLSGHQMYTPLRNSLKIGFWSTQALQKDQFTCKITRCTKGLSRNFKILMFLPPQFKKKLIVWGNSF